MDWLDLKIEEIEYRIGTIILGGIKCLLRFILTGEKTPSSNPKDLSGR